MSPDRPLRLSITRAVGQRGRFCRSNEQAPARRASHSTLFPACATNVQPSLAGLGLGLGSRESCRVWAEGTATTPNIAGHVTEGREGGRAQKQPRNAPAQEGPNVTSVHYWRARLVPAHDQEGPGSTPPSTSWQMETWTCAENSVKDHPRCLRQRRAGGACTALRRGIGERGNGWQPGPGLPMRVWKEGSAN